MYWSVLVANTTTLTTARDAVNVDVMDESGKNSVDVSTQNVVKRRLDRGGAQIGLSDREKVGGTMKSKEHLLLEQKKHEESGDGGGDLLEPEGDGEEGCGSCYGAGSEGQCCNTCDEVRRAYKEKGWAFTLDQTIEICLKEQVQDLVNFGQEEGQEEGCNIAGYVEVLKASGNLHFAPGYAYQKAHFFVDNLLGFTMDTFNLTHTINSLTFGKQFWKGQEQPLAHQYKLHDREETGMYQYYVKVVRTEYVNFWNSVTTTNQYSVTEHFRVLTVSRDGALPGVFFFYDFSPIAVRISERGRSVTHFLTAICAIIGGVFTIMGLVDGGLDYVLEQWNKKKALLGR